MFTITMGEAPFWSSVSVDPRYSLDDPVVKKELGGAGSLEFSMLPVHPLFDSIQRMKTEFTVYQDDGLLFRGRAIDVSSDFENKKSVVCEGVAGYLNDTYVEPSKETETPEQHFRRLINAHNSQCGNEPQKKFTVGNVTVRDPAGAVLFDNSGYRNTKSAIDSDLVQKYSAFIQVRVIDNVNYIDLLDEPETVPGQDITFGWNLLNLDNDDQDDNLFTVLVPIGKNNLTIATVNYGSVEIKIAELYEKYGRIAKTMNFSDAEDAGSLKAEALDYIDKHVNTNPIPELSVTALDFSTLGYDSKHFDVGQTIRITSTPNGIDETPVMKSMEVHMASPEESSYVFADPKSLRDSRNGGSGGSLTSQMKNTSGGFSSANDYLRQYITVAGARMDIIAQELGINLGAGGSLEIKDGVVSYNDVTKLQAIFKPLEINNLTNEQIQGKMAEYHRTMTQTAERTEDVYKATLKWFKDSKDFPGDIETDPKMDYLIEKLTAKVTTTAEESSTTYKAVYGYKEDDRIIGGLKDVVEERESWFTQNANKIVFGVKNSKGQTSLTMDGSTISLEGYVKTSNLAAQIAELGTVDVGDLSADSVYSEGAINGYTGTFTDLDCETLDVAGNIFGPHTLTLENSDQTFTILSTTDVNFKFSDTKGYADAVSAGKNSVSVVKGETTKSYLATQTQNLYTVEIPYTLMNGKNNGKGEAGKFAYTFDAEEAYTGGRNSVKIMADDIVSEGDEKWIASTWDINVTIRAMATNGEYNTKKILVDASEAYKAGQAAGGGGSVSSSDIEITGSYGVAPIAGGTSIISGATKLSIGDRITANKNTPSYYTFVVSVKGATKKYYFEVR